MQSYPQWHSKKCRQWSSTKMVTLHLNGAQNIALHSNQGLDKKYLTPPPPPTGNQGLEQTPPAPLWIREVSVPDVAN